MPFEPFHSRLPAIAETETRSVIVSDQADLPPAEYGFVEMFCNEPGCDCRRVFFTVFSSRTQKPVAVIAYGWESISFYRKWFKYPIPNMDIAELKGPVLNTMSSQCPYAPAILKLFNEVLLPDTDYIERIKRHYKLFRATVNRS
ncbi:MAG: hypothetical protein ACKOEZ_05580 [Spartobacteria bacterium]